MTSSLSVCLYVCLSVCKSVCLFVCLYVCLSVCIFLSFHDIHLTSYHIPSVVYFISDKPTSYLFTPISLTYICHILYIIPCIARTGTRLLWNDPRSVDTLQNSSLVPLIFSSSLMTIAVGIFGREQFNDVSL